MVTSNVGYNSQTFIGGNAFADAPSQASASAIADAISRVQSMCSEISDLIAHARNVADVAFGPIPETATNGAAVAPTPVGSIHALRDTLNTQSAMLAELRGQLSRFNAL